VEDTKVKPALQQTYSLPVVCKAGSLLWHVWLWLHGIMAQKFLSSEQKAPVYELEHWQANRSTFGL